MVGVTQRFGAVTALDNVDLTVEKGTIHAIVGENGAGKTTLMRILYGAQSPSAGRLEVDGSSVQFASSRQAIEAGIGMVSQHYGIVPELTCIQNLILGAEGGPILQIERATTHAQELASRMGYDIPWESSSSVLTPAATQKLEILKLLWRKANIMILDEPTAMLSPADGDALFGSMQQLAREGATILLVTHRLPEVMDYCKRVTVLRGGKLIVDKPVIETSPKELARLIVGSDLTIRGNRERLEPGPDGLAVDRLVVTGEKGERRLSEVSFTARQGEIVGIAGVDGSGQRELFHTIAGISPPTSGSVRVDGKDVTKSPTRERISLGLRVIPEDRHLEGVIDEWSLNENSALGLQRIAPLAKGMLVDGIARRKWAETVAAKFKTRHGGLRLPMASLSGGNQQRFVAARALEKDPRVILAFQPARGLDLGATAEVYQAIRDRVGQSASAVVVSFDLDELLEHCDRIVVMNKGKLFEPPAGKERDREAIGRLMVGAV